jgi:hypothetical protein
MITLLVFMVCVILFLGLIWVAENDASGAGLVAYIILRVVGWAFLVSLFLVAAAAVYFAYII